MRETGSHPQIKSGDRLSHGGLFSFRDHALVVIPRHRFLRDPLIFHGWLQDHAAGELIDHAALDFLPRRLARRVMVAAVLLQGRPARRKFIRGNEDIRAAFVEVDAHPIAGLE